MKVKTDNLDRLFSQFVRLRDGFTCQYTGITTGIMDCAHILSRRHRVIRWDPDNAVCLSRKAHMMLTQEPFIWVDWVRKRFGQDRIDYLHQRANLGIKLTDADRRDIGERLIADIKAMGEKPVCGLGRRLTRKKAKKKASGGSLRNTRYKRKVTGEVVKRD